MPIRLSGLASGLDTEAIVGALVSAYSYKKDKYVKAQTKLSWKQDAWKSLNSKVYKLYTDVGNMRYSSNYAIKKTSVSDNTKAKITASGKAIIGTQTLEIKQLAKTAFVTGGKLDNSVKGETKLSDLGFNTNASTGDASIQIRTGTSTTNIIVDKSTTVDEFVNKLNGAGIQASFDQENHRIFLSGKKPGLDGNFDVTANNEKGFEALTKLGLLSDSEVTRLTDEAAQKFLNKTFKFTLDGEGETEQHLSRTEDGFKNLLQLIKAAKADLTSEDEETRTSAEQTVGEGGTYYKIAKYLEENEEYAVDWANITEEQMDTIAAKMYESASYDVYAKDENATDVIRAVNQIRDAYITLNSENSTDEERANAQMALENNKAYKEYIEATFGSKDSEDSDSYVQFWTQSDNKELMESVGYHISMVGAITYENLELTPNAKKVEGQDAIMILNNETYTSNSNSLTVNGLTIEAFSETTEAINITVSNDTDGLYDKIKDFLTSYNSLINEMQKLYNADSAKDYEPLTDDEKAEMSETEIEKWEQKIKDSLLRRDTNLSSLISTFTMGMMKTYEINGERYNWATFGVGTLGTIYAEKNENYAYHINGDSEDSATSGREDKLRAAIAKDPDSVIEFMKQLTTDLYGELDKKMKSTTVRSVYTVYNDKEMASEYSNYSDLIKTWTDRVKDMEDSYYKKFAAMEKALATLQGNSSSISSLLGGG
ncbi:MAG: hypothetical protein E7272_02365 [Pseudobutyrivibrio ruminis]|uniref:Flagellar hook-associated protein 2 n=1 Tax=Pseudobutyrivibrio ruminis TaxID=46206 RepID=A0A927U5Y0_9FIRM|nr:hypothetical protein [Pseudobutyrivibrio ruminis]